MKRGRVGNGSSKYDFDNGASLDTDVAQTTMRIDAYQQELELLLKKHFKYLSMEQIRMSTVTVMEDMGFLEGRK